MERRILLPTDFSENSFNAIRYALGLYKHQHCDFYVLNVFTVNGYSIDSMMVPEPGDTGFERSKKTSEEGLEKLLDTMERQYNNPKHTFHSISTFNSLLYGIRDIIAKKDIDIVVMGTKGATGSKAVFLGTNTVDIMENMTECPVLTIPEEYGFAPLKEIVFPTDYKANFKRRELHYLIEIAQLNAAEICVLHIGEETKLGKAQQSNKELLRVILESVSHSFHTLSNVKVRTGIATFIESRGSDMVAFINKKHGFFENMISKPLVKEMGYEPKTPLLALHQAK